MTREIIYPELSYKITGILYAVHNELGRFRSEKQHGDAIERCLKEIGIPYKREEILPVDFPGEHRGRNKVDFVVANKLLVEIKAKHFITKEDYFQTKRYLAASKKRLALLVNFRPRYLSPRRIVLGFVD